MGATFIYGEYVGDVDSQGHALFRAHGDEESFQTLLLDGARLLSDRWQAGASLPITRKERKTLRARASDFGVADLALNLGFEALPQWLDDPYLPHLYVFFNMTFPTGGSVYEAQEIFAVDSRGRGFYTPGFGFLVKKRWDRWDLYLRNLSSKSLPRKVKKDGVTLKPGLWNQSAVGGGYSPGYGPLRLGLLVNFNYEDVTKTRGAVYSQSAVSMLWTLTLQAAYMWSDRFTTSLSYSDQTLLAPVRSSTLVRSGTLDLAYTWPR